MANVKKHAENENVHVNEERDLIVVFFSSCLCIEWSNNMFSSDVLRCSEFIKYKHSFGNKWNSKETERERKKNLYAEKYWEKVAGTFWNWTQWILTMNYAFTWMWLFENIELYIVNSISSKNRCHQPTIIKHHRHHHHRHHHHPHYHHYYHYYSEFRSEIGKSYTRSSPELIC